jgi:anthranilate phosphoribosyltransferase
MRFVGPTRREIGIRTIFNSLGPLTNPAGAQYQLLGVGTAEMAEKVAAVLGRLGVGRALVVHSEDGLDEVSLGAPTIVHELNGTALKTYTLTPEDAGFDRIPLSAVRSGNKDENAARLRDVLAGNKGPDREYTLINAGAALVAANKASDIKAGVALAREAIDSGAAGRVLGAYVTATNSFGS